MQGFKSVLMTVPFFNLFYALRRAISCNPKPLRNSLFGHMGKDLAYIQVRPEPTVTLLTLRRFRDTASLLLLHTSNTQLFEIARALWTWSSFQRPPMVCAK